MGWADWPNQAWVRLRNWCRWAASWVSGNATSGGERASRPMPATGLLVLVAFAYQVVSGGLLLLYYQPSVYPTLTPCGQTLGMVSASPAAWCSTYYIFHSVPMGGVLLTSHLYGAYVLVVLLMVHLFRGYFARSYRHPGGKFAWELGVVLLLLTLGMGFTGYLLTYTQLSYNATQVSITLLEALPAVGPGVASLVLGDGTPQGLLSRMFALHAVLLPAAIVLLVFLHKRTTLFPRAVVALAKWGFLYLGMLLAVASVWLWSLPTYAGASGGAQPVSTPAWYFLWVFKLVDFVGVSPAEAMVFIALLIVLLLAIPFLDRSQSAGSGPRPALVVVGNSLMGFFVVMTAWGYLEPGVPASPTAVSLRLAPILLANVFVAYVFDRRRRTSESNASRVPRRSPSSAPDPEEATIGSADLRASRKNRSEQFRIGPTGTAVLGLVGSLFLLPFGLVLPCLFLVAAFLIEMAGFGQPKGDARGRSSSNDLGRWAFSVTGLIGVVALLVAIGVSGLL